MNRKLLGIGRLSVTAGIVALVVGGLLLWRSVALAVLPPVSGSPNVAITSYRTSGGSFILWADGHVTNAASGATVASALTNVTPFPGGAGFAPPSLTGTRPKGSTQVAVAIVPHATGTYVLYADGVVRNPGPPANALLAGSATPSGLYGFCNSGAMLDDEPNTGVVGSVIPPAIITTATCDCEPGYTMVLVGWTGAWPSARHHVFSCLKN